VQVQEEYSIYWDMYDDIVKQIVEAELNNVPKHVKEAIWLQTDSGMDWAAEEEEKNVLEHQSPGYDEDEVIAYILQESVYEEARSWSNKRIRQYLHLE